MALKGNIKHSAVFWCFNVAGGKWSLDEMCKVAKELGLASVELVGPEQIADVRKHGLDVGIAFNGWPGEAFKYGFVNQALHAELLDRTGKAMETCAATGCPSVISFFGYRWRDPNNPASGEIPRDEAVKNAVAGLKQLARLAEKHNVTACVEHLNTRDATHPMKGHPGYMGDDIDFCMEILKQVGSPRIKLLFDFYHMQIMHGDLHRRLAECGDMIGHIHTAGVPGRGELDATQEINYPPLMQALVKMKYAGYVGHEFIPTRDARAGLKQAVEVCDA